MNRHVKIQRRYICVFRYGLHLSGRVPITHKQFPSRRLISRVWTWSDTRVSYKFLLMSWNLQLMLVPAAVPCNNGRLADPGRAKEYKPIAVLGRRFATVFTWRGTTRARTRAGLLWAHGSFWLLFGHSRSSGRRLSHWQRDVVWRRSAGTTESRHGVPEAGCGPVQRQLEPRARSGRHGSRHGPRCVAAASPAVLSILHRHHAQGTRFGWWGLSPRSCHNNESHWVTFFTVHSVWKPTRIA
jgi:hypothetical protein